MAGVIYMPGKVWECMANFARSIEMKKTDEKKKMPPGMMHGKKEAPKEKKPMPAHKGKKKGY